MKPVANSALLHFQVVFLAAFFWNWQFFDTYMVVVHVDVETYNVFLFGTSCMGVSKNRGTPKWMVHNGKPYQNRWFGDTTI